MSEGESANYRWAWRTWRLLLLGSASVAGPWFGLWSAVDEAALRVARDGRLPCFEDWENLSDVVPITRRRLSGIVSRRSREAFFELFFFSFACPLLGPSIVAEYNAQFSVVIFAIIQELRTFVSWNS